MQRPELNLDERDQQDERILENLWYKQNDGATAVVDSVPSRNVYDFPAFHHHLVVPTKDCSQVSSGRISIRGSKNVKVISKI
jgi:hypothetical protein